MLTLEHMQFPKEKFSISFMGNGGRNKMKKNYYSASNDYVWDFFILQMS